VNLLPIPIMLLVMIGFAGGGVAFGYHEGVLHTDDEWQQKVDEQQQAADRKYRDLVLVNNQLAANLEQVKSEQKVVYEQIHHTVERVVERPVYRNVCADDDGLRQVNAALAGRPATDSSQPDATVSAADAAHR